MSELSTTQYMEGAQSATACPEHNASPSYGTDRQHTFGDAARAQRRLVVRQEVKWLLQLTDEQLQWLINTRQLIVLRISGEERFDSRDLEKLIDSYKTTASRRPQ